MQAIQPIRLIRNGDGSVLVETEDWVTIDQTIAFLDLEEPRLAASLRRVRDSVRSANIPGISDQPPWQARGEAR